jgi:hypothetical protein
MAAQSVRRAGWSEAMASSNPPEATTTVIVPLAAGQAAMARPYPDDDPRSPNFQRWNSRQNEPAQQRQREQEPAEKRRQEESSRIFSEGPPTFMENQRRLQEKISRDVERDRATRLKAPPLPRSKNLLRQSNAAGKRPAAARRHRAYARQRQARRSSIGRQRAARCR